LSFKCLFKVILRAFNEVIQGQNRKRKTLIAKHKHDVGLGYAFVKQHLDNFFNLYIHAPTFFLGRRVEQLILCESHRRRKVSSS